MTLLLLLPIIGSSLFFLRLLVMSLILLRVPRGFSWLPAARRLELDAVRVSGLRVPLCLAEGALVLTRLVRLAERAALLASRSNTLLFEALLSGRLLASGSRTEAVLASRSIRELFLLVAAAASAGLRSFRARWPGRRLPLVATGARSCPSSTLMMGTEVT